MAFYSNSNVEAQPVGLDLSSVMRQVYVWMAFGLLVAFGVAYFVGNSALQVYNAYANARAIPDLSSVSLLFNPVVMIGSLIAYFVLAFALQPIVMRARPMIGALCYLLFTALFGFMMSTIFLQFETGTIAAAFIATAGMFGAMSIFGYTTKIDLSQFRNILFMALIGLIVASVVNLLFFSGGNSLLYWLVNYAGVLIFVGLTAYDTQWIKNYASRVSTSGDLDMGQRVALVGAFHLFLDFVNLFIFLLNILGGGRRR
jgi:FtsH-binding integral membrane protein